MSSTLIFDEDGRLVHVKANPREILKFPDDARFINFWDAPSGMS